MAKSIAGNIEFKGDFVFEYDINVRVTDMILGVHLGNDKVLTYITETHAAKLLEKNMSFEDIDGCSCVFKTTLVVATRFHKHPELHSSLFLGPH